MTRPIAIDRDRVAASVLLMAFMTTNCGELCRTWVSHDGAYSGGKFPSASAC
jgi:hypothetical protein